MRLRPEQFLSQVDSGQLLAARLLGSAPNSARSTARLNAPELSMSSCPSMYSSEPSSLPSRKA